VGLFEPATGARAAGRLAKRSADMGAVVIDAADANLPELVRSELGEENLPIVCFGPGDTTLDARFDRLGALAGMLATRKVVVLRRRGGLGRSGKPLPGSPSTERGISVVNLRTDLATLRQPRTLPADDLELLEQLSALLSRPDCAGAVASVTSPLNLLRELFTVKGAGTLIKPGTAIERHDDYSTVDTPRLKVLLEASFGRRLVPGYFDRKPMAVFLEENYRGAAIVAQAPIASYLTKFAVDRVAQGEGMGRDLWEALVREHGSLYWRSRSDNPICGWYQTLCEGMVRTRGWTVFWRGVDPMNVPTIVEDALARGEDFLPSGGT